LVKLGHGVADAHPQKPAASAARGLTNQEIAERLFVTQATAKTHANRAMMKLGARDRTQLVVIAYETGLVQPGSRTTPT